MTLVNGVATVALVWGVTSWRPRWSEVSVARVRELWPYSSRILWFNGVKALVQNSDRLVIGFLLGPRAVGLYTFAFRVVVFPVRTLSAAVGAYLFPRMSRIQADLDAVREEYMLVMRLVLAAVVPAMVVAALASPLLITAIFGQRWAAALVPMQILTIASVAGVFYTPVGDMAKALNRPAWMVAWALLYALASCVSLWLGSARGLTGAVSAFAGAHVLLIPVVLGMANALVGLRPGAIVAQWGPSILGGASLAVVVMAGLYVGADRTGIRMIAAGLVGLAVYSTVLFRLDPGLFRFVAQRLGPRLGLTRS
jgi:PST family polysaccharide transporter